MRLSVSDNAYSLEESEKSEDFSGFYAKYHEGFFVFFTGSDGKLKIGWNGRLISISEVYSTHWHSDTKGRKLVCYDTENQELLTVSYHTFLRFGLNPFKLLSEVFMPDDDWGLVADLPSFVCDFIERGSLQKEFDSLLTS